MAWEDTNQHLIEESEHLTDVVDVGNLYPSSFSADTASLFKINFEVAHNLEIGDYIVFSDSTEAGWNNQWEVGEVLSQKSIKIKNTYTFPTNNPSGDYELKRRYLPTVKLRGFRRRTDTEHENIAIFRKKSGTFRRIAEIDPDEIEDTSQLLAEFKEYLKYCKDLIADKIIKKFETQELLYNRKSV